MPIKLFKEELKSRLIAGDVYMQATSIEDEVNGIIDPPTGVIACAGTSARLKTLINRGV